MTRVRRCGGDVMEGDPKWHYSNQVDRLLGISKLLRQAREIVVAIADAERYDVTAGEPDMVSGVSAALSEALRACKDLIYAINAQVYAGEQTGEEEYEDIEEVAKPYNPYPRRERSDTD